jgi:hypothetical protein
VLKPEGRPSWMTWSARSRASTWKSSSPWVTPTPSVRTPTTRSCRCAAPKPSRLTWCPRASKEPRVHRRQGQEAAVASNKTAEGRAKNRRVEIEVVGTRAN